MPVFLRASCYFPFYFTTGGDEVRTGYVDVCFFVFFVIDLAVFSFIFAFNLGLFSFSLLSSFLRMVVVVVFVSSSVYLF